MRVVETSGLIETIVYIVTRHSTSRMASSERSDVQKRCQTPPETKDMVYKISSSTQCPIKKVLILMRHFEMARAFSRIVRVVSNEGMSDSLLLCFIMLF